MASIAIYGQFIGDCTANLVAFDTDNTLKQVGAGIAAHAIGRRWPAPSGSPPQTAAAVLPPFFSRALCMALPGLRFLLLGGRDAWKGHILDHGTARCPPIETFRRSAG